MSQLSPDQMVAGILDGSAPQRIRAAAARGALPLPRAALVRLYLHLRKDDDDEVRQSAETSLGAMQTPEIRETLTDPACAPEVLMFFSKRAAREEDLAERIAFHPLVPSSALAVLAATGSAPVVELVLTNQEQLLAAPGLLEKLMINPALRTDQRGRILDMLDRLTRQKKEAAPGDSATAEVEEETGEDLEEIARLLDIDVGELLSRSEILDGEEFAQSEDVVIRSAYQRILVLNSAQKAILAMKGGREERMILVRDSNKVVALGVLKNPRITDQEIEVIAAMRNVTDEVLRHVGSNREWSKTYLVVHTLVQNPRTPPAISMNFIPRLTTRDLKNLKRSRDVPELIRRMVGRTLDTRTQSLQKNFKKK